MGVDGSAAGSCGSTSPTAEQTPVGGEIPGLAAFLNSESTFDAVGRRLFLRGLDDDDVDRLYVIDAQTGAVIASPALPPPPPGTDVALNGFEFDELAGSTATPTTTAETPTDTTPPETTIDTGPVRLTTDATPTFTMSSSEPGSSFHCLIDGSTFTGCASPHTTVELPQREHTFQARAIDPAGNIDATPASRSLIVVPELGEIGRALRADVKAAVNTLKRLGIDGLLEKSGFTMRGFDALTLGTLRVRLAARIGRRATASRTAARTLKRSFAREGRYRVRVKVTKQGKRLLRRSRRQSVAFMVAFSDPYGRSARRATKVTLRR